jgi:hypothetical protein
MDYQFPCAALQVKYFQVLQVAIVLVLAAMFVMMMYVYQIGCVQL